MNRRRISISKAVALFATIALAVGLCPGLAFAGSGQLVAAPESAAAAAADNDAAAATESPLQTQAGGKVALYLLTNTTHDDRPLATLTYQKGLLTKRSIGMSGFSISYTYKDNLIKTYKTEWDGIGIGATAKLKYDKQNRLTRIDQKRNSESESMTISYLYNKKNQVSKRIEKSESITSTYSYKYDKQGKIKKCTLQQAFNSGSEQPEKVTTYKYDSKGNLTRSCTKLVSGISKNIYKNTYRNGLLVEQTIIYSNNPNTTYTTGFSYKKVKVPKKYAETIQKQQWAIINMPVGIDLPSADH